jgi:DNA-binding MarR family transcriptional regulator
MNRVYTAAVPVHEAATAELARELRETVGRFIRRLRAEPGPPVAQMTVLSRLGRDGAASVSDLAAAERMRPQSMAPIVRDLEQAGLVQRRPDPDDGRRALVELTPAGIETLGATRARREDWLTEMLDRELDADDRARLRAALELLGRLADA